MLTGFMGFEVTSGADGMLERSVADRPRFTVLMNAYNGEDYIGDAIASVLRQTDGDFELLIWDDCSTDRTREISLGYADARIRYLRAESRVDIGIARNEACALARGEWIAFLDQDDLWVPDKLARQRAVIDAGDDRLGLVYGRTVRFGAAVKNDEFDPWHRIGRQPEGDIFRQLLRHPSFVALSSACVRTTALRALGDVPRSVRHAPDYWIFLNIAQGWRAACVQSIVCRYRVHATGMSQVYARKIHQEALAIATAAARPGDGHIVGRRRRVVNAILAIEDMRQGRKLAGIARLFTEGSFRYFFGWSFLHNAWRPALRKLRLR